MKKITYLILFAFATSQSIFAQTDAVGGESTPVVQAIKDTSYWKRGGSIALNFNNTSLTNWAAGGNSSVALGSIVDLYANYLKGKDNWVNNVNWAAGMSRVGGKDELIKKSDDLLIGFTKYRRNVKENWGFAAFAELRTQVLNNPVYVADSTKPKEFSDGFKEKKTDSITSSFLSTGYLTSSIGWEYNKGKNFYLHATVLAGRATFMINEKLAAAGGNGFDPGQRVNFQLGALMRSGWKFEPMKNVTFSTNMMLFSPYENFGNIDVTWETLTSFKINKYLSSTFSTQLLYFDAARPKTITENGIEIAKHGIQYKQVLNIGFLAKF